MRTEPIRVAHAAFVLIATLFFLLLLASAAAGQEEAGGGLFGFLKTETAEKYGLDTATPEELIGVVLDDQEKPVAEATVYLRGRGRWGDRDARRAVTDKRGQFLFDGVSPGEYAVAAMKGPWSSRTERRKWREFDFDSGLGREPEVLKLKPVNMATVRVVDAATQEPLPGAKVEVKYPDLPGNLQADEEGKLVVEGLYDTEWTFVATDDGYAKKERVLSLKNHTSGRLTIELKPGAALVGQAMDPEGNPIPKPRPHLRDPADPGMFFDFTPGESDGTFRFDHVPAGMSIKLDFDAEGFVEPDTTLAPLAVGETRQVKVTFSRAPRGGSVFGVVTDADGQPIPQAEVSVAYQDHAVTYADNQGKFRLDNIDERREELIIKAPGFATRVAPKPAGTREKPGEVNVELEKGNNVYGRVVDEQGDPVQGAYIDFPQNISWGAQERLRSDANGEFQSDRVPAKAIFRIYASGFSEYPRGELELNSEEPVEIVMKPEGEIKGVALDASTGDPLNAFNVRMTFSPDRRPSDASGGISTDWDSPGRKYESDAGHFEIDDLDLGLALIVTIEAPGYRPATIRRVVAERPDANERHEFRLVPEDSESLISVAGVVRDSSGDPAPNVEVRLVASVDGKNNQKEAIGWYELQGERHINDAVLQSLQISTDDQGRFRFDGVYSDCTLDLAYWGTKVSRERVRGVEKMTEEERNNLTIEVTKPASLVVSVNPANFPHARGVRLYRSEEGKRDPRGGLSNWNADSEGRWAFPQVAPGEYLLTVSASVPLGDGSNRITIDKVHEQRISLESGEDKTIEIEEPILEEPERP